METLVLYSDCISVETSHDDEVLAKYSNKYNFAGIDYTANTVFEVLLEGRFFRERQQEQNESDTESDGNAVKLSSTTKTQRLLEVEPAPYYIHERNRLILQHNYIFIDGEEWIKEEAYETKDVGKGSALASATVWLTRKSGGTFTNVYGTV